MVTVDRGDRGGWSQVGINRRLVLPVATGCIWSKEPLDPATKCCPITFRGAGDVGPIPLAIDSS